MRTDADDLARVRDPALELLLSHTATLTDPRPLPVPHQPGRVDECPRVSSPT